MKITHTLVAMVMALAVLVGCGEEAPKEITCPLDGAVILPMQCVARYKAALVEAKAVHPAPKPVAPETSAPTKPAHGDGWRFDTNLGETKISLECHCPAISAPAATVPTPSPPSAVSSAPPSASPTPTDIAPQPDSPTRVLRRSTRGGTTSIFNIDGLRDDGNAPKADAGV